MVLLSAFIFFYFYYYFFCLLLLKKKNLNRKKHREKYHDVNNGYVWFAVSVMICVTNNWKLYCSSSSGGKLNRLRCRKLGKSTILIWWLCPPGVGCQSHAWLLKIRRWQPVFWISHPHSRLGVGGGESKIFLLPRSFYYPGAELQPVSPRSGGVPPLPLAEGRCGRTQRWC